MRLTTIILHTKLLLKIIDSLLEIANGYKDTNRKKDLIEYLTFCREDVLDISWLAAQVEEDEKNYRFNK